MKTPFKIALIEDEPAEVWNVMEWLDAAAIHNQLLILPTPEEASAYLENRGRFLHTEQPDMILFGIRMWEAYGVELMLTIREFNRLHRLPVVILRPDHSKDEINRFELYANCYFAKRDQLTKLINVVRSFEEFWISIHPRSESLA